MAMKDEAGPKRSSFVPIGRRGVGHSGLDWPVVSLADVSESVRYGYTASSSTDEIGPKFLRITDIVPRSIGWRSVPYCEGDEEALKKYLLDVGDIVVARTGATVGYAKQIRTPENAVFASYLVRFRIDSEIAEPSFIGHLVESQIYKQYVKSQVGGAAQPNANAKILGRFSFTLPPRRIQRRVAGILSTYDDLIENNRRRIALLEKAAREIHREWFVRLRFPGHESTRFVGGVPQGWERVALENIGQLRYGKSLKAEERTDGDFPVYGSSGVVGTHDTPHVRGPGIIVGRKGNVGSVYWSDSDFCAIDTVYYVEPSAVTLFLYYTLKTIDFINTDVAVPGLNRSLAHSREFLLPTTDVQDAFHKVAQNEHRQMALLRRKSSNLEYARDLLLPRLMSGKVAV